MTASTGARMLDIDVQGRIVVLTMNRPGKRNAMCEQLLAEIDAFFSAPPPEGVRVAVLTGVEGHYCSGLDLSEHVSRSAEGTIWQTASAQRISASLPAAKWLPR